ncbi:MAG: hypothetical protein GY842_25580 [bacterium]|nr:hypothetical protein [bacterium]
MRYSHGQAMKSSSWWLDKYSPALAWYIPMRFYRRNGRQMILTDGKPTAAPAHERSINETLIEAIAKAEVKGLRRSLSSCRPPPAVIA